MKTVACCVALVAVGTTVACTHAPAKTRPTPVVGAAPESVAAAHARFKLGNIFSNEPAPTPPTLRLGNIF